MLCCVWILGLLKRLNVSCISVSVSVYLMCALNWTVDLPVGKLKLNFNCPMEIPMETWLLHMLTLLLPLPLPLPLLLLPFSPLCCWLKERKKAHRISVCCLFSNLFRLAACGCPFSISNSVRYAIHLISMPSALFSTWNIFYKSWDTKFVGWSKS